MKRRINGLLVATVIVLASWMAWVPAWADTTESLVKIIPDSSLGFLVLNRLGATNEKIVEVQRQLNLPAFNPLAMLKDNTGIKEGLDETRSAAIVAMPGPKESSEPAFLLFVPVTDFSKLIAVMNPKDAASKVTTVEVMQTSLVVRKVADYALFAEPRHVSILERVGVEKDVSQSLPPWGKWLAENDIAVVVTRNGVKQVVTQIRKNMGDVEQILSQMPDTADSPMAGMMAIMKIYTQIMASAEKEIRGIGVGLQRNQDGALLLTGRKAFVAGGAVAKAFQTLPPVQGDPLAGMPDSPFVVAFSGVVPENLVSNLMRISSSLMSLNPAAKLSKAQMQKLSENTAEFAKGLHRVAAVLAVGKPGEDLYGRLLAVSQVDDAIAYLEKYEKYLGSYNELVKGHESVMPPARLKKIEINGKPALQITMDYSKLLASDDSPMPKDVLEKLLGQGGKVTAYVVAADKHTLLAGYTNQDRLRSGMQALQKSAATLTADKGVAATAALLPADAPWIGYWSPSGTVDFASQMIAMFGENLPSGLKLPEFPKTTPIGFAAKVSAEEIQSFLAIPSDVMVGIGSYIKKVEALGR